MSTKLSTRSNATLTTYVKTCDRLAALNFELKQLEAKEQALRPEVLEQIGTDPRPVTIAGQLRIVRRDVKKSVSIVDEQKALEYAKANGLKVQPAKGETVATQTLRGRAIDGMIPEGIVSIEETQIVVIV
jgi:outer membrane receptor for ferric coprogen and ferric-rhodotorulic acid